MVTDTLRRSSSSSPKDYSPNRLPNIQNSISQLVNSWDYESLKEPELLDSIPQREWRLLATLAKKREDDEARNHIADQFRDMWEKDKIMKQIVEQKTSEQYRRYLLEKRRQGEYLQTLKNLERINDQQMRRENLLDTIRYKDQLSINRIADINDKKTCKLLDKALKGEVRSVLANDKRLKLEAAQELQKQLDLFHGLYKVDNARRKRSALLKDTAQRTAIANALSNWESTLVRKELNALDEARRAQYAAHAALTDLRSTKLSRAREQKQRRARRIAHLTQQLRDVVKNGWM